MTSRKRGAAENPAALAVCHRCGQSSSTSVDLSGIEQVAPDLVHGANHPTFHSIDCLFSQVSDKYGSAHRITTYIRAQLQLRRPAVAIRYVPKLK